MDSFKTLEQLRQQFANWIIFKDILAFSGFSLEVQVSNNMLSSSEHLSPQTNR